MTRRQFLWGALGAAMLAVVAVQHNAEQGARQAEQQRVASLSPEQRAKEEKDKVKRDAELQVGAAGALALKQAMKDPAAFVLTSLVVKPSGTACYEYRAKNSYGATFPGRAVGQNGKVLVQERDGNAFVKLWNKECTVAGGDEIGSLVSRILARQ